MNHTPEQYLLFDLIERGGATMVPLLLCSLLAIAVVFERFFWGPRRNRVLPPSLLREIRLLIHDGKMSSLGSVCSKSDSPLARIASTAFRNSDKTQEKLTDVVQATGKRESQELHKNLGILATIAAISPLLGLLGTVFGMIETFTAIQREGIGNAPALAGGISEALITTAAGLTIAIPTLVFYRYFLGQARKLTHEMEAIASEITEEFDKKQNT